MSECRVCGYGMITDHPANDQCLCSCHPQPEEEAIEALGCKFNGHGCSTHLDMWPCGEAQDYAKVIQRLNGY